MADLKLSWTLPTTRKSGKPLAITDIDYVSISISADNGDQFIEYGRYEYDQLSVTIPELEPGVWWFSGRVVDTAGRSNNGVSKSFTILDTSPPEELVLTITL